MSRTGSLRAAVSAWRRRSRRASTESCSRVAPMATPWRSRATRTERHRLHGRAEPSGQRLEGIDQTLTSTGAPVDLGERRDERRGGGRGPGWRRPGAWSGRPRWPAPGGRRCRGADARPRAGGGAVPCAVGGREQARPTAGLRRPPAATPRSPAALRRPRRAWRRTRGASRRRPPASAGRRRGCGPQQPTDPRRRWPGGMQDQRDDERRAEHDEERHGALPTIRAIHQAPAPRSPSPPARHSHPA